jgi:D-beta-D-heptose 7-phosphate kinase/D-beta-D-heptose 1-phosphate adenosyltransferase
MRPDTLTEISHLTNNRQGQRVVFTNGCFDVLHVGHTRYLSEAKSLGHLLVVGLNSDSSIRSLKGPDRPINPESERKEMLLALRSVDFVLLFDEDTPYELIRLVEPDLLVKGGDWLPEQIVGSDLVLARGGVVKSLSYHSGRSTTELAKKISKL